MRTHVVTTSIDNLELKYFKTVLQPEAEGPCYYGVLVEKLVSGELVEKMESGPVCENDEIICEAIELLAENDVMPFTLLEVLDEMEVFH